MDYRHIKSIKDMNIWEGNTITTAASYVNQIPESDSCKSLRAEAFITESLRSSTLVLMSGGNLTSDDATSVLCELGAVVTDGNPSNLCNK